MSIMNGELKPDPRAERRPCSNRAIGDIAEKAAEAILLAEGYRILRRSYTVHGGEIDLIAEKDGALVFVEVKARSAMRFGQPEESVNLIKRRHLIYAAKRYLYEQSADFECYRFDVMAFDLRARTYKWFRDAFGFGV